MDSIRIQLIYMFITSWCNDAAAVGAASDAFLSLLRCKKNRCNLQKCIVCMCVCWVDSNSADWLRKRPEKIEWRRYVAPGHAHQNAVDNSSFNNQPNVVTKHILLWSAFDFLSAVVFYSKWRIEFQNRQNRHFHLTFIEINTEISCQSIFGTYYRTPSIILLKIAIT